MAPLQRAFLDACLATGSALVSDHNAPEAVGVGAWPTNGGGGIRHNTALTYLAKARVRSNLAIRSGVLVNRIVFDWPRATGVVLAEPGETIRAIG